MMISSTMTFQSANVLFSLGIGKKRETARRQQAKEISPGKERGQGKLADHEGTQRHTALTVFSFFTPSRRRKTP
jgi:hypothetical protein